MATTTASGGEDGARLVREREPGEGMSSRRRPRGFQGCRGGLGRVRDDAGRVELARRVRARGDHALHPSGRRRKKTSLPLVGWARTGVGPGASVTGHKGELQVTFCSILFSFCFSFI